MSENLSSAAVVIGALRTKIRNNMFYCLCCILRTEKVTERQGKCVTFLFLSYTITHAQLAISFRKPLAIAFAQNSTEYGRFWVHKDKRQFIFAKRDTHIRRRALGMQVQTCCKMQQKWCTTKSAHTRFLLNHILPTFFHFVSAYRFSN